MVFGKVNSDRGHISINTGPAILRKKNNFRNPIRVSNSLDPDQAQYFIRPDQDPDGLQK